MNINNPIFSINLEPHEDELFYGYLYRLAMENGCQNMKTFIGRILLGETDCHKVSHVNWNLDGWNLFPAFFKTVDIDPIKFIMEHSLYPFQAIFLTPHRQAMVVDTLFNDIHAKNTQRVYPLISELHYCEKCKEEEMEKYGHHYLHRAHQLPGVKVCHKHGVSLKLVSNDMPLVSPFEEDNEALRYAQFAKALLCANLQTNITKLQQTTMKRLAESKNQQTKIPDSTVSAKYSKTKFYSPRCSTITDIVDILIDTFGTVENLKKHLPENNKVIKHFVSARNIERYDVFQPFHTTVLRMRHKDCGTEFFTTPAGFVAGWKCPTCAHKKLPKKSSFEEKVKELVGDEYIVVDEYKGQNTPIEILHRKCGCTLRYYPKHFLNGQRCILCNDVIAAEEITNMVEHVTSGQYTVNHVGSNLCEFQEEGGATFEISLAKFLQEIRRPTPSDVLPVPVKNLQDNWHSTIWENIIKKEFSQNRANDRTRPVRIGKKDVLARIRSLYREDQLIFMEDLRKQFPDDYYKALKSSIKQLIAVGKLFRVETGIYTLTLRQIEPMTLLKEKYLVRNGERIGIYDSKSLAYKMGLSDEKPETIYIMTNKESMAHGRKRIINGLPVHIRGNSVIIDENNYKYVMVLEAIKYCFHYDAGKDYRIKQFIKNNNLAYEGFIGLFRYYSMNVRKLLLKMWEKIQ